jgi:hypothetical protein
VVDDPTAEPLPGLPDVDLQAMLRAMAADGVDPTDQAAVRKWMAGSDLEPLDEDLDDEDLDDVSVKELFGLPDRLPPVRLPPDDELAAAARTSRLLARARGLAGWVGERRAITDEGEPSGADCVVAAQVLGIEVPDSVERLAGVPELAQLWELAVSVEMIELGEREATPGPALQVWPDGDDEDVLDVWATALAVTMTSLDLDADAHEEAELDLYGAGGAVVMALFLARNAGLPFGELSSLVRETADPTRAGRRWEAWVRAHGDPVHALLDRLDELGTVRLSGEDVRLTPLALWAMWAQLDGEVDVPVLPPVEEMTAADLVAAAGGFTEEELAAELSAWLGLRGPEAAARELLEVAAAGEPADRMYATSVVAERIGAAAEPNWRAALDDPALCAYAKLALDLPPGPADMAWLLTDVLAAMTDPEDPEDIARHLRDAVPAGQEAEFFDQMWRLPHPWAGEVLNLLGAHHPDKLVAKAARKAAFKAASKTP